MVTRKNVTSEQRNSDRGAEVAEGKEKSKDYREALKYSGSSVPESLWAALARARKSAREWGK